MEAYDACLDVIILAIMLTEPFRDELLPSIGILGLGGIGVFLFQGSDMGIELLVLRVHTGGGRIEIAFDPIGPSRFKRMQVDERVITELLQNAWGPCPRRAFAVIFW